MHKPTLVEQLGWVSYAVALAAGMAGALLAALGEW